MKYIEFQNAVQQYLNRHGHIEGYIRQQERMARFVCNDVIEKFPMPYKLSLVNSSGCGIFYELHASIPLETTGSQYDAVIGRFTNNGTIRKQAVRLYLNGIDKYGDEEFTRAVRMVAMDFLHENVTGLLADYERKSSEADMVHEKVNQSALIHGEISLSLMSPEEYKELLRAPAADMEQRKAREILEKEFVRNTPKGPVTVRPVGDWMFGLTSMSCSRKSWVKLTKDQEWTIEYFSGDIWSAKKDGLLLYMSTGDIIQFFGQDLKPA